MALINPFELQGADLHDEAGSRAVEQAAYGALPALSLMRRAGRAVARLVLSLPCGIAQGPIVVVAGSGHNGGDGWSAALELKRMSRTVWVWEPLGCTAPDAQVLRQEALDAHVALTDSPTRPALVIDALLGLGAKGVIRPNAARAIEWMQSQAEEGVPVLSVDVPSGLCADTGRALPDATGQGLSVRADHTVSLLTLKPGLFTGEGREQSGRIWFDDLGAGTQAQQTPAVAQLATGHTVSRLLNASRRDARGHWRHGGHKGVHGDVRVLGGAQGMTGAAVLAAHAALRAGAGRVYLHALGAGRSATGADTESDKGTDKGAAQATATRTAVGSIVATAWPEIMVAAPPTFEEALLKGPCTVVAGCGGGSPIATMLPALLHRATRLVLDADALNALSVDDSLQQRLKARQARGLPTILTPHPLEAARLLGCSTADVQADRLKAATALAERLACTVVLKGSGTITATVGCTAWINGTGNARLSTAGTGDVLAGWIAGAWSALGEQAASASSPVTVFELAHALAAAVVELHGLAASAESGAGEGPIDTRATSPHTRVPLSASDVIDRMANLL